MKTKSQIEAKLKESNKKLNSVIPGFVTDANIDFIKTLRDQRVVLQWVLLDDEFIDKDELTKKIDFEILCYESTKIF